MGLTMILLILFIIVILVLIIGILKKKKVMIVASVIVGITLISCVSMLLNIVFSSENLGRSYHHRFTNSTNLSKENIEGLHLNDKINDEKIVSKYGEISKLSQDNSLYNYYYLTKDIEVATEKDNYKIIRFVVDGKNLKSEKGISVGDSKEQVIDLYGENYYTRIEQGVNIIGYIDQKRNYSIEFWLDENGVSMIRFDYDYMV